MTKTSLDDQLFMEILAWGKGFALAEGSKQLDVQHIILGSLKVKEGCHILADLLNSDIPLDPDKIDSKFADALSKVNTPVTNRKLNLTPRLKKITDSVWSRQGSLTAKPLLSLALKELEKDEKWGLPLLKKARQHPRKKSSGHIKIAQEILSKVNLLKTKLSELVVGQQKAIEMICDGYFTSLLALKDSPTVPKGPQMLFTFLGPPGVGKTYTAECLSEILNNQDSPPVILRLNMSAYSTHQAHEQLIGFSKSYKGAEKGILSGFASDNPDGFILVDEFEKAHPNTQHLFLQILDAGQLYENNSGTLVDFSNTTIIFTSNLGRQLYDTPNRSGVLQESRNLRESILEALRKESNQTADQAGKGLSPELVSRLAKGHVVLFEYLEGLALERILDLTLAQVSSEIKATLGTEIEINDPIARILFLLRFGVGGDARRLKTGVRNFLYQVINDILTDQRETMIDAEKPELQYYHHFSISLSEHEPLPDFIKEAFARRSRILLVDDSPWDVTFADHYSCEIVSNKGEADTFLSQGCDFVLLDLYLGSKQEADEMDAGLAILHWLRTRYPEIPVYVFTETPEKRGLSETMLERICLEGGARGVLRKRFYSSSEEEATERDAFFRRLDEIDLAVRRQKLVSFYNRRGKVLDFDIAVVSEGQFKEDILPLEINQIRELTVVSVLDRNSRGWVDLPKERFEDIAGAQQAKQRLLEVSEWLTDPGPLIDMGLEMPKGILLTGPPGTGKTTMARAVAGEVEVPFFAISGSEIFNKFVGESEAAIRELFTSARRYAPSIIFIDEIDSLGVSRSNNRTGSRVGEQVLNELLAQMDGFQQPDRPVFVMAATNRPDILDSALVRSGRFDLQIEIPYPNTQARKEIFDIHLNSKPLANDVVIQSLATRTAGLSGADIKQICKEAGMLALREKKKEISRKYLQEAITVIKMGLASEQVVLDKKVKRATAIHEAGHLLAHYRLLPEESLVQVSILPRGRSFGFVEHVPENEYSDMNLARVKKMVQVLLAGRAAEKLLLEDEQITSGCSSDMERATVLTVKAVAEWGMDDEFGVVSIKGLEQGLGTHGHPVDLPSVHDEVIRKARKMLLERYDESLDLLTREQPLLEKLAQKIEEKETLYSSEIEHFFAGLE